MCERIRGDTNRNRLDHGGIAAVVDGQVQERRTVAEPAFERTHPTPDERAVAQDVCQWSDGV